MIFLSLIYYAFTVIYTCGTKQKKCFITGNIKIKNLSIFEGTEKKSSFLPVTSVCSAPRICDLTDFFILFLYAQIRSNKKIFLFVQKNLTISIWLCFEQ